MCVLFVICICMCLSGVHTRTPVCTCCACKCVRTCTCVRAFVFVHVCVYACVFQVLKGAAFEHSIACSCSQDAVRPIKRCYQLHGLSKLLCPT